MVVEGKVVQCARTGCTANSRGNSSYCSDSCRAKASHQRNYIKRGAVAFDPKPRDPVKRADQDRWRRLVNQMKSNLTFEEARECVRLAVANKLVSQSH